MVVTLLFINGKWRPASDGQVRPVIDPATEAEIGTVAQASMEDVEEAVQSSGEAFKSWKLVSAFERSAVMRAAAQKLRERSEDIARMMTAEQGKPLAEARAEVRAGADIIDWCAEEGRRAYGRIVPSRAPGITQHVLRVPVGPVAAFTPWNFPVNQAVRKIGGALASGCTIILKGPEDTPASCAALIAAFADAGLPAGVINLVFGKPREISPFLISHPVVRKVSFTGSTAVGKELAALAGAHMKRTTMELGGHAPALVFADADPTRAARELAAAKYRNAGQICISPTRFVVEAPAYDEFLDVFAKTARGLKVGSGMEEGVNMGPLVSGRRLEAIEAMVQDAVAKGAQVVAGGRRAGNKGYFFEPTVLADVPADALVLHEEPFGPIAIVGRYVDYDAMIEEANRLEYGLAAYAYTNSATTLAKLSRDVEAGVMGVNHQVVAPPEVPFGGIKDSGYGSEGGSEILDAYLDTRLVSHLAI